MRRFSRTTLAIVLVLFAAMIVPRCISSEEPVKEGGWLRTRDEQTGLMIHSMEMTLYPKAEPRPALKYRLIPDDFDMLEGNAAVQYLKAMGFLEQTSAHTQLLRIDEEAGARALREGVTSNDVPPRVWQKETPETLPLEEVKEFLQLTSFQTYWLAEAAKRRHLDLDRNIRGLDNVLSYGLPDIQSMRELARLQSLRCKVAIADDRVEDAIDILGQQYALVRHLGQDEFIVSCLVGIACGAVAWNDALYLVQHEDAPNLYWALASMPRPIVDMQHSLAVERQFLFLQLKSLQEVDETPRPPEYWRGFVDRLVSELGDHMSSELAGFCKTLSLPWTDTDPEDSRSALVAFIAVAYPSAKRFLIEECGLDREQVDAYPTAQAVFLAIVRYAKESRDGYFKWQHLPYWQAVAATRGFDFNACVPVPMERAGWIAAPAVMFLQATRAARTALAKLDQQLALLQAVEAIRMYGASHDGNLPPSLDDLPVPVPMEPFTGKALAYRCHGDYAVLSGHEMPGKLQYRLILRFATSPK